MEGRGLGVRVSTAVPGIVDTPIYDRGTYSGTDTKTVKTIMKRKLLTISAATAADRILSGTARNRAFIHTQRYVRLSWLAYRYVPHVYRFACRLSLVPYRRRLRKTA
jgi:short-subunit dehydrogenase